ncbi:hypothetical protein VPNG_07167 [Cytospora leucostoma]|uniref:DUF7708 domain-containing protein n=1 Tax=Cytospora leucostoma TaxID=1230097 RepID=A0A423WJX8_9PEZI|nr:hypothetical protein VPNG_07167 [Cytospora leucostoma]
MSQGDARKRRAAMFTRRFSPAVALDLPNNDVAQALNDYEMEQVAIRNREAEGLMKGFQEWLISDRNEGDERYAELHRECTEVIQVWIKFQADYPDVGIMMPGSKGPPSVATLKETVDSAIRSWKTRHEEGFGKVRKNFQDFSETVLDFSDIFTIIPQGDKYISLFTGIISTVVKASARTSQIGEGFSNALVDITKDMNFSRKQFKIHQGPDMQALVTQLYVKYLKFFCYCMEWFSSKRKRIVAALKQDFYNDEVKTRVDEIKGVVKEINRQAQWETDKRVHEQPTMSELRDMLKELFPNIASRPSQTVEQSHNVVVVNREELQAHRRAAPVRLGKHSYALWKRNIIVR